MKKILFIVFCLPLITSAQEPKTFFGKKVFDDTVRFNPAKIPYLSAPSVVHLGIDTLAGSPTYGKLVRKTAGAGGGGYTTLSQFVDETAWRMFYSNTDGDITPFAFGTSGKVLTSNGVSAAPTWEDAAGGAATYIVQTSASAPTNAQVLASLSTGLVKNTTGTGVLSIAVAGTDYATASGIHYEAAVRAATTTAGTLATSFEDGDAIDGVTLATGNRILIKNQSAQEDNGIYTVNASGAPTRATDFDQTAEIVEGDAVFVTSGTANGGTSWYQATAGTITVGTTPITFTQIGSAGIAWGAITGTLSNQTDLQSALDGKQAADADLTTYAGITPSANVQTLLGAADYAAFKSSLSLNNVDNTSDATKNSATATLTNKRVTPRTGTEASSATPTINTDNVDFYSITALAVNITSMTTNLSGTPTTGQKLRIDITGTAARGITWGASFSDGPVALPTTTVTTNTMKVLVEWDGSIWRCMAAGSN